MPLVFLVYYCGVLGSSSGKRDVKNDHIYVTLYIGISWQGSETSVCELSHHIFFTYFHSHAQSYYHNASSPDLSLGFQGFSGVIVSVCSLVFSFCRV